MHTQTSFAYESRSLTRDCVTTYADLTDPIGAVLCSLKVSLNTASNRGILVKSAAIGILHQERQFKHVVLSHAEQCAQLLQQ